MDIAALPTLLHEVRGSRIAVSAATGTAKTGGMEAWKTKCDSDIAVAKALLTQLPPADTDFSTMDERELESRLIAVHTIGAQATQLRQK